MFKRTPSHRSLGFSARILSLLFVGLICLSPVLLSAEDAKPRKIVFIAGKIQSHPPGCHEYEKDLALLKQCLDESPNLPQGSFVTELHLGGWPEDPTTLRDADTIVMVGDGSDRKLTAHTLMRDDHLEVLEKQMDRGCGLVLMHYSLFVPSRPAGEKMLDWIGGFFDYQDGPAANGWYSKIQTATATPGPASPAHPISRGLRPEELKEEYYFNFRFRENDPRLSPILTVKLPNVPEEQTIAWAVERDGGGRGFAFGGGHFPNNWQLPSLRKMMLNAIVWTAHLDVPPGGVESVYPGQAAEKPIRTLLITGHHHPGHPWQPSSAALRKVLWQDPRILVDTIEDPDRLRSLRPGGYDALVLNYCNWERGGLCEEARRAMVDFLQAGGGMTIVHFANGAWGPGGHPATPEANWPEFTTNICRRVWIDGKAGHDAFGPFQVDIAKPEHPITQGLTNFSTRDELYCNQQGDQPIEVLATAHSKVTDKDEPMAAVYTYGKGRIFQCLLGHAVESIENPGAAALLRRGTVWVAGGELQPEPPLPAPMPPPVENLPETFGKSLDMTKYILTRRANEAFVEPPLTVECWVRINDKSGFNVFVSNDPKDSPTHWEIYSFAGTGALSVYMPGYEPAAINTTVDIADGRWHFVAMTFDGKKVAVYEGGKLALEQEVSRRDGQAERGEGPLAVGMAYVGDSRIGCNGAIDELRISKTIRPIQGVPEGPLETDEETIGLWHFDENPLKLESPDASGRGNKLYYSN